MQTIKRIAAAALVTLSLSALAFGSFAAFSPAGSVIAHTRNQPGEYDAG